MTPIEMWTKSKEFLNQRRLSYRRTFNTESIDAQEVLKDLAKFCRAHEPAFHADQRVHALLEGRREVWLRIQNHLQLKDEDLWKLYDGRK